MKKSNSVDDPDRKMVNFTCDDCQKSWKKPVPYFIRHNNRALQFTDTFEYKICKRCAVREFGSKNKKRKEFFNEI